MKAPPSSETSSDRQQAAAEEALRAGRWDEAERRFREALELAKDQPQRAAECASRLGEALWWLGRADEALAAGERAYSTYRSLGDDGAATHAALWLAREHAEALGNDVASAGWLARAETLAVHTADPTLDGWTALTRAFLSADPLAQGRDAEAALAAGRDARDGDLELLALGRLGLAWISLGRMEDGLAAFNEAMAAATAGEASRQTLAQLCCQLSLATEVCGEIRHFARWIEVVQRQVVETGHPQLVAFCATCCAEVFCAAGDWAGAERELRRALATLARTGHRARCIPPASKLAELLALQGRIEEADQVIAGDQSDLSLLVRARLALERKSPDLAVALVRRHCRRIGGDTLLAAPALALLADAHLAAGDPSAAGDAAERLAKIADGSGNRRAAGRASLARARIFFARGLPDEAVAAAESALDHLGEAAPGSVEAAEAHLLLARLHQKTRHDLARAEAKAALTGFEKAGATRLADETAALLRALGDRSRVGAKGVGNLTDREQVVLRLLARGLTNVEIAGRLSISVKTAGNHVSNILMKLGLRSRVEAAAFAVLQAAERPEADISEHRP